MDIGVATLFFIAGATEVNFNVLHCSEGDVGDPGEHDKTRKRIGYCQYLNTLVAGIFSAQRIEQTWLLTRAIGCVNISTGC